MLILAKTLCFMNFSLILSLIPSRSESASDRQPPKLPANRVGNDSGTVVKFLAVNPNPISAEREKPLIFFFAMFNFPKGDMMGIGSVFAVMFLFI